MSVLQQTKGRPAGRPHMAMQPCVCSQKPSSKHFLFHLWTCYSR